MSWLARSLANSLRLEDDAHPENDVAPEFPRDLSPVSRNEEKVEEGTDAGQTEAQGRGVKEDLTELRQTLTRQLWGVASFLAPPPTGNDSSVCNFNQSEPSDRSESCYQGEPLDSAGIRHDFAEIRGRFRSGVTEISKIMTSNYIPFGSEENEGENQEENEGENEEHDDLGGGGGGAIGVTDEVLSFARNIAMHPETWLDFPLDEEEDLDDFDMSDAQREHALAIERFAPRLAALRIELCPCHMTESYFWKVYFVLLHSRLNKHDAEILSTPQVMEARAMWMQELHKKTKPDSDWNGSTYMKDSSNVQYEDIECTRTFDFERTTGTTDYEAEKQPNGSKEMPFIDKSVIEEKLVIKTEGKYLPISPSCKIQIPNYEDDEDDWPDEEDSDLGGYKTTIPIGNEEDISFSDLEDDDANSAIPIKFKTLSKGADTSTTKNPGSCSSSA